MTYSFDPPSVGLFDNEYSFDYQKAIREAEEAERKAAEAQAKKDEAAAIKQEQQAFRRQQWALALPAIAAALTANDTGEIQRALSNYSELASASLARRQQAKQAQLERTHDTSLQERRLEATSEENVLQRQFQSNLTDREIGARKEDRMADADLIVFRDNKQHDRDMEKAEYDRETRTELEKLQSQYQLKALREGARLDAWEQDRTVSRSIFNDMTQYGDINPEIAQTVADKLSSLTPINTFTDEQRAVLDLWNKNRTARSDQERQVNMLDITQRLLNQEVGTGRFKPVGLGGEEITRQRTPQEVAELFPALKEVFNLPVSPEEAPGSDGKTESERTSEDEYQRGRTLVSSTPEIREVYSHINNEFKREESRGVAIQQAVQAAKKIQEQYSTDTAMGLIDSLNIDNNLKTVMRESLREQKENPAISGLSRGPTADLGLGGNSLESNRTSAYGGLFSGARNALGNMTNIGEATHEGLASMGETILSEPGRIINDIGTGVRNMNNPTSDLSRLAKGVMEGTIALPDLNARISAISPIDRQQLMYDPAFRRLLYGEDYKGGGVILNGWESEMKRRFGTGATATFFSLLNPGGGEFGGAGVTGGV